MQIEPVPVPLVTHNSYANEEYAIQGRNTSSRKCPTQGWSMQHFLFTTTLYMCFFEKTVILQTVPHTCICPFLRKYSTQFNAKKSIISTPNVQNTSGDMCDHRSQNSLRAFKPSYMDSIFSNMLNRKQKKLSLKGTASLLKM